MTTRSAPPAVALEPINALTLWWWGRGWTASGCVVVEGVSGAVGFGVGLIPSLRHCGYAHVREGAVEAGGGVLSLTQFSSSGNY